MVCITLEGKITHAGIPKIVSEKYVDEYEEIVHLQDVKF